MKIQPRFFSQNLQKYGWDCGVAVAAFLLSVKGENISRRKIIKELRAGKSRGTDLTEIAKFFGNRSEFEVTAKDKLNFAWIEKELSRGRVALVAYQNWQGPKDVGLPDWGHYGVIFDIQGDKVRLFDPGEKSGLTEFTKEEFLKRWYEDDLGVHYVRWAMSLNLM